MTPLAKRRIANFKANRRGYYALWVFLASVSYTHLTLPTKA